ncbi:response regulator transcription factor [bacterium]|jgi:DNA-binding NarL/FixJ family response regulator|nr:response regulator transcription factor [Verrucomicrobiota bacterium]MDA7644900.1 response regulator transcription factor [bacterium]
MEQNGMEKPWRTILVEDQALLRNVLAKAIRLDQRFELVADAEDGLEGKRVCEELVPDLLITDIHLPGMDGVELAAWVIKALPSVRVLALTNMKDPFTLNRLQEIGIHGYVEKDQPLEILEEAMVEIASGHTYFTATIMSSQARLSDDPNAFSKVLSARDQEILCLVAQGETSKVIGERLELSRRSVETYRYRIMKKLGLKSSAELVDYAYKNGFTRPE